MNTNDLAIAASIIDPTFMRLGGGATVHIAYRVNGELFGGYTLCNRVGGARKALGAAANTCKRCAQIAATVTEEK